MRRLFSCRLKKFWTDLHADKSGIAVAYIGIAIPVLIGFSLLAIDVGRMSTLQSSLQHGADALALAGAGELDRSPTAITRANRAIANLVTTNQSLFATTVVTINASNVGTCFLEKLPPLDATPVGLDTGAVSPYTCLPTATPANVIASSEIARYVQVKVNATTFNTIFPATFLGASSNSSSSSAEAVAGFDAAVCNFTPMFLCNPYEANGNIDIMDSVELMKHFDRTNYPDRIGRQIDLKQTGGNSAQYFPGNFGFLQPPSPYGSGAADLRELVGIDSPPACYIANGVQFRTGAIESVRFGFNTRFDMYEGPMNNPAKYQNNESFRPALDTRKGMATDKNGNGQGSACNPTDPVPTTNASKLLQDTCFNSTCPNMGGRMGDGVWDKTTYWSRSHNGAALPGPLQGQYVTRYDVYQYEIGQGVADLNIDSNGNPPGGEKGTPSCYGGPTTKTTPPPVITNPDRRIFHAAVLNCKALVASNTYKLSGSNGGPYPVVAFVRFFMTEPMGGGNGSNNTQANRINTNNTDGDLWAEMVGIDQPGDSTNTARDRVQLYR